MQVAVGAMALGIVIMIGYLIIAQVRVAISTATLDNITTDGLASTQSTIFAGFGLLAVSVIALGAFGLIQIFQ